MSPHFPRLTLPVKVEQMQLRKEQGEWGQSVLPQWQPPSLPGGHHGGEGGYIFSLNKGNVSAQCDSSEPRQESLLREHSVNAITIHNTMITARSRAKCWNKLRYEYFSFCRWQNLLQAFEKFCPGKVGGFCLVDLCRAGEFHPTSLRPGCVKRGAGMFPFICTECQSSSKLHFTCCNREQHTSLTSPQQNENYWGLVSPSHRLLKQAENSACLMNSPLQSGLLFFYFL